MFAMEGTPNMHLERLAKSRCCEDGSHVLEVICPCSTEDQDVIEKDEDEAVDKRPEDITHECLEGCRGVSLLVVATIRYIITTCLKATVIISPAVIAIYIVGGFP
jgi:hypothetical protein